MALKICIARVRRARQAMFSNEELVPNCTNLARAAGVNRRLLSHALNDKWPSLGQELNIVRSKGSDWKQKKVFKLYRDAGMKIRGEGDLPCFKLLAEKLGYRRKRVIKYLAQHPKLAEDLCLYDDDESLMWRSARAILQRNEEVTRLKLADEMDRSYGTVMRILKTRPKWVDELCIVRAGRNSGVRKRLYPHQQTT